MDTQEDDRLFPYPSNQLIGKKGKIISLFEIKDSYGLDANNKEIREENSLIYLYNNWFYLCKNDFEHTRACKKRIFKFLLKHRKETLEQFQVDFFEKDGKENSSFVAEGTKQLEKHLSNLENRIDNEEDFQELKSSCVIVEEKVKGWESYGWSKDFPHKKILVGWSRRQKIEEITNMGGLKCGDIVHFEINQERQKSAKQGEVEANDWSTDVKIEMKDEYFRYDVKVEDLDVLDRNIFLSILGENHEGYECIKFSSEIIDMLFQRKNKYDPYDSFRRTHTYLMDQSNIENYGIYYSGNDLDLLLENNRQKLKNTIYRLATENIITDLKNNKRWLIVSDERPVEGKMCIFYAIISPNAENIRPLSPGYHGSDKQRYGDETDLISKLISENKEIFCYSFEVSDDLSDIVEKDDFHLQCISKTLPIITEIIRCKVKMNDEYDKNFKVQFLGERISGNGAADAGQTISKETTLALKELYTKRNIGFEPVKPWRLLSKSPSEHPLIQYADIIGRFYDEPNDILESNLSSSIEIITGSLETFNDISELILCSDDAITTISKLITSKNREVLRHLQSNKFLNLIFDESIVSVFMDGMIEEMQKIIMENNDLPLSQNYIGYISGKIGEYGLDLKTSDYKINFEMMMGRLSHAIKRDDYGKIDETISKFQIIKTKEEFSTLMEERVLAMQNLFIIGNQNMCNFDIDIEEAEAIYNKKNISQPENNLLGAMALSLLLKGGGSNNEDFLRAERYETKLRNLVNEKDLSFSRRMINYIEIEIIKNPKHALTIIQEESKNSRIRKSDGYYIAAILKCISMSTFSSETYEDLELREFAQDFIQQEIDLTYFLEIKSHPQQRIAYWYILAHTKLFPDEKNNPRVNACSEFLIQLYDEDRYSNILGVILASELLDLYHRFEIDGGLHLLEKFAGKKRDFEIYLDKIIQSQKTALGTKEWVEHNTPDKEDWLRALNYNYR